MIRIWLLLMVVMLLKFAVVRPLLADEETKIETTVGAAGRIQGLVLPGSELHVAPLNDRQLPIMLRIVEVWKHGDSFRYDLEFIGLEAGNFDLRSYLERKDGSDVAALPPIPIRVNTLLPPGQVIPHELKANLPFVARYRVWAILAAILWLLGLLAMIFWQRKSTVTAAEEARPKTFAELLAPRLAAASSGELNTNQLAELERFVVEFWRRRLGLSTVPVNQAILQLRRHAEAGPLLWQLEKWIHAPQRTHVADSYSVRESISLAKLLEPYHQFPAELQEAV